MNRIALILSLFLVSSVFAQTASTILETNDTEIAVSNNGTLFIHDTKPVYFVPKNTLTSALYYASIVITGIDEDSNKCISIAGRDRYGFVPGPRTSSSGVTQSFYDKIFVVKRIDVEEHIKDPSNPPNSILEWPGNGDTEQGEPLQLAPFEDLNNNGIYEPLLGDYPLIKGEIAAYCIYNSINSRTDPVLNPMEVEVHQMFYQEAEGVLSGVLDHTNLAWIKIINRSNHSYSNVRFGIHSRFNIGNPMDDFMGTDTNLQMMYNYNADNHDEDYGVGPPALGIMFFDQKVANTWFIYDYTFEGKPMYNLMYNRWQDGKFRSKYLYYQEDSSELFYMFPGNPYLKTGETEYSEDFIPGYRVGLMATESFTLNSSESWCINMAFVYGRSDELDHLKSVNVMKSRALLAGQFFHQNRSDWKDTPCKTSAQTSGISNVQNETLLFYPNPSSGIIQIPERFKDDKIEIFSANGSEFTDFTITGGRIILNAYTPGLYVIRVGRLYQKVILQ